MRVLETFSQFFHAVDATDVLNNDVNMIQMLLIRGLGTTR